MSRSKVIEIIIGACVISAVITVQVMIAKHERAEEAEETKHGVILICTYDGGNK